MTGKARQVLLFLSAPPELARTEFLAVLEEHRDSRITVYIRDGHRKPLEDLLADCFVHSDKPTGSKRTFIRELRAHFYDEVIVLDFGQWNFYPSRCLFFLARAEHKTVRTERGSFVFSPLFKPFALISHLLHRSKNRTGSVAGMPPALPFPFVFAAYRKTIGLAIGIVCTILEYGWRRITR